MVRERDQQFDDYKIDIEEQYKIEVQKLIEANQKIEEYSGIEIKVSEIEQEVEKLTQKCDILNKENRDLKKQNEDLWMHNQNQEQESPSMDAINPEPLKYKIEVDYKNTQTDKIQDEKSSTSNNLENREGEIQSMNDTNIRLTILIRELEEKVKDRESDIGMLIEENEELDRLERESSKKLENFKESFQEASVSLSNFGTGSMKTNLKDIQQDIREREQKIRELEAMRNTQV